MTLRIPLKRSKYLTLISVYAPTLTSDDETKDSFYDDLHRSIRSVPKNDKLVVLGDLNARVEHDHLLWDGLIGKHGHGNCNANGRLLLGLCTEHDLTITNTLFRLPLRQKTTWRHPRLKHWHMLDYVLTRKRDIKDVCITRSMPGADDCWKDHRLLLSRLRMNIRVPPGHPTSSRLQRRFDCHKLKDPMWISRFQEAPTAHLDTCPPSSVNKNWISLRDALTADELTKAMKRIKPGKAPGPDNVPFELLNSAGPAVKSRLMELLTQIWNSDSVPPGLQKCKHHHHL